MNERIYGYAGVSSKEQNINLQLEALKNAGVTEKNIFIDKSSGKDFEALNTEIKAVIPNQNSNSHAKNDLHG